MKELFWRLVAALGALAAFIVGGCGPTEVRWSGEDSGYQSTTPRKPKGQASDATAAAEKHCENTQRKP